KKQAVALEYLKGVGECELAPLCEKFGRGAVNSLADKGAIQIRARKVTRNPFSGISGGGEKKTLTPAQAAALESIEGSDKTIHL
ncbi:hypothetical protein OFB78_30640, partial [Escherichia coli]|nr:hypothetical protein [Escherichia coli]